ncbi:hypothetical protein ScalyP_jg9629 [Parmales sp. scaly parma]|nr:hypothetical protein ScalyP_jg9629 [Parmales sp. scaly parma]
MTNHSMIEVQFVALLLLALGMDISAEILVAALKAGDKFVVSDAVFLLSPNANNGLLIAVRDVNVVIEYDENHWHTPEKDVKKTHRIVQEHTRRLSTTGLNTIFVRFRRACGSLIGQNNTVNTIALPLSNGVEYLEILCPSQSINMQATAMSNKLNLQQLSHAQKQNAKEVSLEAHRLYSGALVRTAVAREQGGQPGDQAVQEKAQVIIANLNSLAACYDNDAEKEIFDQLIGEDGVHIGAFINHMDNTLYVFEVGGREGEERRYCTNVCALATNVPATVLFSILKASGGMVAALGRDGIVAHLKWLLMLVGGNVTKFARIASCDGAMARLDKAEFRVGLKWLLMFVGGNVTKFGRIASCDSAMARLDKAEFRVGLKWLLMFVGGNVTKFASIASCDSAMARLDKAEFRVGLKWLLMFVDGDMDKFGGIASCTSAMARLDKAEFRVGLKWLLMLVDGDMDKFRGIASCTSAMARLDKAEFRVGLKWLLMLVGGNVTKFGGIASCTSAMARLDKAEFRVGLKWLFAFVDEDMDKFGGIASCTSAMARLDKAEFRVGLKWLFAFVDENIDEFGRIASGDSAMSRLDKAEFRVGLTRALALFDDNMNTLASSTLFLSPHLTNNDFMDKLEAIKARATNIQDGRGLAVVKYFCNAGRKYLTNEHLDAVLVKLNGQQQQQWLKKLKGSYAISIGRAASFLE